MANPPRTGAQKALRITSIVAAATIIAAGASAGALGADEAVNFHGTDIVGILVLVLGLIDVHEVPAEQPAIGKHRQNDDGARRGRPRPARL